MGALEFTHISLEIFIKKTEPFDFSCLLIFDVIEVFGDFVDEPFILSSIEALETFYLIKCVKKILLVILEVTCSSIAINRSDSSHRLIILGTHGLRKPARTDNFYIVRTSSR